MTYRLAPSLLGAIMTLSSAATAQSAPRGEQCPDASTAATADSVAARFDDHQFVFIGSTHGDLKIERFLMCLVSRPAFTQRVTDIVAEQASSAHQRLLDRYVLAGETIPSDSLAYFWLDTDAPTLWTTLPQVRQFLETLRDVNRALPAAKRVRFVGGNVGVNWSRVSVPEDLAPYPYKTNFVPHLLIEHLAKEPGNRTLVVYGDCHIHWNGNNFMGDLEYALGRKSLYVVGRIGELVPAERPFLQALGNPDRAFFVPAARFPANTVGQESLRVCLDESSGALARYIDAFVYLGPHPDTSLVGSIALTAAQQREVDRRTAIALGDHQRSMRARYGGRAKWFAAHPNDLVSRPR